MRDAIGNSIAKGNLLYWKPKDVVVQVLDVVEPVVEGNSAPPVLVIMLQIPISGVERGREAFIGDFLRVPDPASEARLAAALTELPPKTRLPDAPKPRPQ